MLSVGLHLRLSGRQPRAAQVDRLIRYAKGFPGVWFARRIDIARWWLERYGDLQDPGAVNERDGAGPQNEESEDADLRTRFRRLR